VSGAEHGFRFLSEQQVHQGYVWRVVQADFEAPDGGAFRRDIVRSPGAVGVVPVVFDVEGNASVLLVSQYRPPYEELVLEIPAGMRDIEGEDVAEVARRELAEEAGMVAGDLLPLTDIYPSPGLTDSVTTIFLATHCGETETDRQGPEEEAMEAALYPLEEALSMIDRGEIRDAKTVVGLLMAARRLDEVDHPHHDGAD
jgi:ADP-ribose pyrophosphatase